MNIQEAIARSESHTEIVHLTASTKDEARAMIAEAISLADDNDLEADSGDTNEGYEVWACKPDSEAMEWRIAIKVEA